MKSDQKAVGSSGAARPHLEGHVSKYGSQSRLAICIWIPCGLFTESKPQCAADTEVGNNLYPTGALPECFFMRTGIAERRRYPHLLPKTRLPQMHR